MSVANRDKRDMIFPIKRLADLGFEIVATVGTGAVLRRHGIECEIIRKHFETVAPGEPGYGMSAVELISSGEVRLVINTPQGSGPEHDSTGTRSAAPP